MDTRTVKQYSARLELPNHTIIDFMAEDQGVIKEIAQRCLNGGAKFEPQGTGGLLVYHPSFANGNQPLGWIAQYEVPEHMSTKALAESRQAA
jgi:hypothetical protein